MDNKTLFLAHCLEEYKKAKQLNGKQVIDIFIQYGVLDYIVDCYDALHTTNPAYIVDDIDMFIATRK